MNLLIGVNVVDSNIFEKDVITNFDILSQIIPPISLYKKSKRFKSDEDPKTSNHIIEIKDGHYMNRAHLDSLLSHYK